ncbi:MAG TPA: translation initiation factor [Candidatus Binatia bacterium]
MKKKERVPIAGDAVPLRQPLPGLEALRARLPAAPESVSSTGEASGPAPGAEPAAKPSEAASAGSSAGAPSETSSAARSVWARAPRLVVRRERKGHGGKTATRIEGLVGSTVEIENAVRELKRALGCGAVRDGDDVVVQGAQGERLVRFLEACGARKVVVGS